MSEGWREKIVDVDEVIRRIKPGDSLFLSTGTGEPRTLIKSMLTSEEGNIMDVELIQLVSIGDTVSIEEKYPDSFRLKTFFAGWVAYSAIAEGRVDLIPARFSKIPSLISSETLQIDIAFVQISLPDDRGYVSLGVSVDAARQAIEQASFSVGEINPEVPYTLGNTLIPVDAFDCFVESSDPVIEISRPNIHPVFDGVAKNIAELVNDGSCVAFSLGSLYEALAKQLTNKRELGIHSAFVTDAIMDLIKSGAVTNQRKGSFLGRSVVSYAYGTRELYDWLHKNPLVEFQGIDVVADPKEIAKQDNFIMIFPSRQVDLTGEVAFHTGRGRISAGPGESQDYLSGVSMSEGGKIVIALPSRNRNLESNILPILKDYQDSLAGRNLIDYVVTENGIAALRGRTVRQRAMALIDIAHPDYREELINQAKDMNLIYKDQIYIPESATHYPNELIETKMFPGDLMVKFRPILPSDEEQMRRLFYRFSDKAIYYRYFSPMKAMPHYKMQLYVNVDHHDILSLVGVVGDSGYGTIIAEGRYVMWPDKRCADLAFVVDEGYQNRGIASYLLKRLIEIAKERNIEALTADILSSNKSMLHVLEKANIPYKTKVDHGVYHLTIPLTQESEEGSKPKKSKLWGKL